MQIVGDHAQKFLSFSFHGLKNASFSADACVVGYLDMTSNSNLAGNDAVFANFRRPGNTCLGGDHCILTYLDVVSDLYQVVERHSVMNDGGVSEHRGAVDNRVGADRDVILDDNIAKLGDG